jgi:RNA polymerase sigma-70 factor (ECF subfamily)
MSETNQEMENIYRGDDDDKLLKRLKAGDEEAFNRLYCKYRTTLLIEAKRYLQDEQEAQDIVQDFFINLWEKKLYNNIVQDEKSRQSVKSYFTVSIKYRCINRQLQKDRWDNALKMFPFLKTPPSTSDQLENKEQRQALITAMNEIPPKAGEVFRLAYLDGKKHHEIAEELGISANTVRNHIAFSLKFLRKKLKISPSD